MIEVEVRNFQSIEKAVVRLEGFTALVGRSNIGKSALVRAVKCALTGAPVSSFVRHGATCPRRLRKAKTCSCAASVRIRTEGFDLHWEKGDAINRYTFNGTVYDKVEKGTPDFLQEYFALVKVGESKELLQVADQFTPIFLLDQTGTVVADVLSDVARLDRINVAMRDAERDRREAASTRKVREKDVTALQVELEGYAGLDETLEQTEAVGKHLTAVQTAHGELAQLGCYIRACENLEGVIGPLEAALEVAVPPLGPMLDQQAAYHALGQFYNRLAERAVIIRALSGVENIEIPSAATLREAHQAHDSLEGWVKAMRDFQQWFDQRKEADKIEAPSAPALSEALTKFKQLDKMARDVAALAKSVAGLETDLRETEQMAAEIQKEFEALGVCPTCTKPLHLDPH